MTTDPSTAAALRPAERGLCVLCNGSGRYPPGVCRRCDGAGWDPEFTGEHPSPAGTGRVPVLRVLALVAFLALCAVEFAGARELQPGERVLASVVLAALFGWPALFALARSFGAGRFGRALSPALTVLAPVAVMLVFRACGVILPGAEWPGLAAGLWLFAQLAVVPLGWAVARAQWARRN